MIIEDDFLLCRQIQYMLQPHYEVASVPDFEQIVAYVLAYSPHLILLDINLP